MTKQSSLKALTLLLLSQSPLTTAQKSPRYNEPCPADEQLPCENTGRCVMGMADYGYHGTLDLPFLNTTHVDFKHCECPSEYTGLMCEHRVETCGNDEHACFNGAKCVRLPDPDGRERTYTCDCRAGEGSGSQTSSYAGHMCEHAATSFCEYGVAVSKHAFCVNGGTCKDTVVGDEEHPGCTCPDGYTGDHCEYEEGKEPETTTEPLQPQTPARTTASASNSDTEVIAFSLLVAVIVIALLAVFAVAMNRIKRKSNRKNAQQKPIEDASAALDADGGTLPSQTTLEIPSTADADVNGEFI